MKETQITVKKLIDVFLKHSLEDLKTLVESSKKKSVKKEELLKRVEMAHKNLEERKEMINELFEIEPQPEKVIHTRDSSNPLNTDVTC